MKKVVLCVLLSLSLSDAVAVSASYIDKTIQFLKERWAFIVISGGVLVLNQCQASERLELYLRLLHQEKIDRAFEYVKALKESCQKITLGVHTEKELLYNLHAVGLDNQCDVQLLLHQFSYVQSVVNDYVSWRPWNWTKSMKEASEELSLFLQRYQPYRAYLDYHAPCLRCWEMLCRYKELIEIGVTDVQKIIEVTSKICAVDGNYYLVDIVSCLREDLNFIKQFLSNKNYREQYPLAYHDLKGLLAILQMSIDLIEQTSSYIYQWDKLHKENSYYRGNNK